MRALSKPNLFKINTWFDLQGFFHCSSASFWNLFAAVYLDQIPCIEVTNLGFSGLLILEVKYICILRSCFDPVWLIDGILDLGLNCGKFSRKMRRRATDFRRPVRRRFSWWIWVLLLSFLIAGFVLFVVQHNYSDEDQVEQPVMVSNYLSDSSKWYCYFDLLNDISVLCLLLQQENQLLMI